jgi:ubiquinone/menaquinone biosynthesis C-methylase UbiE
MDIVESVPEEILRHYEAVDEGRRITEGFSQLELVRTQEILRRYLTGAPVHILDVGGGKGVHAAWLASDGHHVHVIDPVAGHVQAVRRLEPSRGRISADLGDARDLPFPDTSFDAALVMGPLYHLTERDDRRRALGEARRVVRPGGYVFAAGISRFASLFDGLAREFLFDADFREIVEQDVRTGEHRSPQNRPHWFTTAFFHHPDELKAEAGDAGLDVIAVLGIEGLAGWLPHLAPRWQNEADRQAILMASRAVEAEPSLIGLSAHLLLVARRR